jgi:hypothetical protein
MRAPSSTYTLPSWLVITTRPSGRAATAVGYGTVATTVSEKPSGSVTAAWAAGPGKRTAAAMTAPMANNRNKRMNGPHQIRGVALQCPVRCPDPAPLIDRR